ncbi:MAG: 2-oxo acid dehydrogenase subunit E2 [Chloroflexi bacterium]|nr:MAG: 2-oxo acid dehydrogenase subunit E2 [Chloroflexota bacterium]
MKFEFQLPRLSEDTDEGVVVAWFKQVGSQVKAGETLLEVQMEKVSFDVEAPVSGRLVEIRTPKDEIVKTGQVVAVIETTEEVPEPEAPTAPPAAPVEAAPEPAVTERREREFVPAAPAARRLAREHGIDLAEVQGTGRGGRITLEDVQRVIEAQKGPAVQSIPIRGMRKTIAQRMHRSLQDMAQVTLVTEADVTELVARREALKAELPVSYTDLILKAVALTLREHPHINATATGDEIQIHPEIHIGVAVALDDGLQVPVVRDVDQKTLAEIAQATAALAEKARAGQLTAEDVAGGTFTVTNLGTYDVDAFTPIINPPQVAILGVGRIVEKPAVHDGEIIGRAMMTLSLTFDHRIVDGAPAAAFLKDVKGRLENPDWLSEQTDHEEV